MSNELVFRVALAGGLGVVAAGANLLGGYFVVRKQWPRQWLQYFVALGAGYMLAVALLEVIPESLRLGGPNAMAYVLVGYFLIHLFEHTVAPHLHALDGPHTPEVAIPGIAAVVHTSAHGPHQDLQHRAGTTLLLGLAIHTFFDGVAIASGFLVSTWLGAVIFLAVFLHKLPEGFTVASVVLASGLGKRNAMLASGLLGGATLLGVILTNLMQGQLKYALPISGGVTLYVAATDLLPEVNREPNWRMAFLVFVGVATLLIMQHLFHV